MRIGSPERAVEAVDDKIAIALHDCLAHSLSGGAGLPQGFFIELAVQNEMIVRRHNIKFWQLSSSCLGGSSSARRDLRSVEGIKFLRTF